MRKKKSCRLLRDADGETQARELTLTGKWPKSSDAGWSVAKNHRHRQK